MSKTVEQVTTPSLSARRLAGPISVLDLFTIGIGPSSSHTVGPMRAAHRFIECLGEDLWRCRSVVVELYGSLALTGKGHRTDIALLLGLSGWLPESVDPEAISIIAGLIRSRSEILLGGRHAVGFDERQHLTFRTGEFLPGHSNGMKFAAHSDTGVLLRQTYYSVGGGAIVCEGNQPRNPAVRNVGCEPYPFTSAHELLTIGERTGLSIADIVAANELSHREETETIAFLDSVRDAMMRCIDRGCVNGGVLPGGLKVPRRAPGLLSQLKTTSKGAAHPFHVMEWVSLFALAVNEENAAGGRVVTAPTNGAAGVIPAVLKFSEMFFPDPNPAKARIFLLTASAIGMLYKRNASISAAEMGCQGEVGVACSMAAAGLVAVLGGTNRQIENAAEIGMEHNLGLTCDPIGGLVQIPCIERNTMGAIKAINAAMLALHGDGRHHVSLDAVIETMRQTGEDMRTKYKETSLGGLAVNVVDC
ncbi:L-serine ammonia-lyase [Bradyrhizobium sp. WSM2254]|uniref:L-serine ammonia-lyase n=1 Tax=Bradyrhizobium sp. WSM2254 TaxID=1188263 RepID=UPI0009FCC3CD|nr:L-serine ammonia-lyase [Bradyrhizobium sp. WSM2254]